MRTWQYYDVRFCTMTSRGNAVERCALVQALDKDEAESSVRWHYGACRGFRIVRIDALGQNPF